MDDLNRMAKLAGQLHSKIASDVFPDGALLTCERCGESIAATPSKCAGYLRAGWPMCCGLTMMLTKSEAPR